MRFRLEQAVRFNLIKPIFTSKLCTWNVPSGSKVDVALKRRKYIYIKEDIKGSCLWGMMDGRSISR